MLLARFVLEGEADEIAMNSDIDTRRSAVGGKGDVPATWSGSPLLAINGPKDERWKSQDRPYGNHFFPTHRVLVCALTFQQLELLNQVSEIDDEV